MRRYSSFFTLMVVSASIIISCSNVDETLSEVDVLNSEARIPAELTDTFKAVVKLTTPKGSVCSGTFINRSFILTAAHCVIVDNGRKTGTVRLQNGYRSRAVYIPKNFDNNASKAIKKSTDIALVRFSAEASNRYGIRVFPKLAASPKIGETVYIAGYGRRSKDGKAGRFAWGKNTLFSKNENYLIVQAKYERGFRHKGAITHRGDSGGPLFNNKLQIIGSVYGGSFKGSGPVLTKTSDFVRLDGAAFKEISDRANKDLGR